MAESLSVAATVNQSICSKQTSEEIMYVSTRTRREKYLISKEELIRPEDIHVEIKNSETQSNLQKADEQEDIDLSNTDSADQCKDIPERIQQSSSNNTADHDDQKVRRIGMVEATEKELTQKRRQRTRVLLKKFGEDMEMAVDMPRIFTKKL